jgi:hypothetical protein
VSAAQAGWTHSVLWAVHRVVVVGPKLVWRAIVQKGHGVASALMKRRALTSSGGNLTASCRFTDVSSDAYTANVQAQPTSASCVYTVPTTLPPTAVGTCVMAPA